MEQVVPPRSTFEVETHFGPREFNGTGMAVVSGCLVIFDDGTAIAAFAPGAWVSAERPFSGPVGEFDEGGK